MSAKPKRFFSFRDPSKDQDRAWKKSKGALVNEPWSSNDNENNDMHDQQFQILLHAQNSASYSL